MKLQSSTAKSLVIFFKSLFLLISVVAISACGGGGGGGNGGTNNTSNNNNSNNQGSGGSSNIALATSGADISSTFSGNESFVIDGNPEEDNFWAPGDNGDSLTIELSKLYSVGEITVYNNGMTSNNGFEIALSANGTDFEGISIFSDCYSMTLGSLFYCELDAPTDARYVRLTILQNAENTEIHEIEITES